MTTTRKKRPYIDVNVPSDLEEYLNELLDRREIQLQLEMRRLPKTHSSLGRWIIEQFLINNTRYRFEHVNTFEDRVVIQDRKLRRILAVFIRNDKLHCELCEDETECEHVEYANEILESERGR